MVDITSIESEYRRIMKSRRSMVEMTKMADRLFQTVSDFYATLSNEDEKTQFRTDYIRLAETGISLPHSRSDTNKTRLATLMLDHARNLKAIEATKEKLNRELGDF
jgi:hypothetical protein